MLYTNAKDARIKGVRDVDILVRCYEDRSLIKTIRQRQLKFAGNVIREESVEKLVVEGKVAGKRAKSRQRITYTEGLTPYVAGNVTSNELLHAAADRQRYKNILDKVPDDARQRQELTGHHHEKKTFM